VENQRHQKFLQLYSPIHDQLFRFCRATSGNLQDAEDLLQDTVVAALDGLKRLKDHSAFKSFIFSIASNLNKMRLRRGKFSGEIAFNDLVQIEDGAMNAEAILDFKIIHEKMMLLPARTAESMILYHISDLPIKEISKIQRSSESAVKLRLHRRRKKLLRLLNTPEQKKAAMYLFTM
jgi:RNA polymerase sigma-70 factor (ECF subfamily)